MKYRVSYAHPTSVSRMFRFLTVEARCRMAAAAKVRALIPGAVVLRVIPGNMKPFLPHPERKLFRFTRLFMP